MRESMKDAEGARWQRQVVVAFPSTQRIWRIGGSATAPGSRAEQAPPADESTSTGLSLAGEEKGKPAVLTCHVTRGGDSTGDREARGVSRLYDGTSNVGGGVSSGEQGQR